MIRLRKNGKSGVVLPIVIMLIFCGFIVAAMLAIHAGRSLSLTRRSLEYQRASVLADSGIGYGLMYVKNEISKSGWGKFLRDYPVGMVNTLVNDNSSDESEMDLLKNYDREYRNGVCFKVVKDEMDGGLTSEEGCIEVEIYSISRNVISGVSSAVKETIRMSISQLGDYAAFYEYDLEAWPGENMTFVGKVHSNGDLWIGADKLMKFDRNVTASGNFYAQRKPDSGYGDTAYVTASGRVQFRKGDDNDYDGTEKPAKYADVINTAKNNKRMDYTGIGADRWYSESTIYYGGALKTGQSKLSAPISVADDPHTIIEKRLEVGQSGYNADTEAVKFSNKACLTIHIDSNGGLHLYDRKHQEIENPDSLMQPAASVSKASTTTGQYNVQRGTYSYVEDEQEKSVQLPAYEVNNYIYDRRDENAMQPVDIYIDEILSNDKLKQYLYPSNISEDESAEAGVLYITRDDPQGYPHVTTEQKPVYGPVTNVLQKTSTQVESGWEQYKDPTQEPLYTVKRSGATTYYYYYYDYRTRSNIYTTTTTYRGTQYTENRKTYKLDSTKTVTSTPTTIATGKTLSEATDIMNGHSDYYKEQESGTKTVYYLQKTEITTQQTGTETLYITNYIPTQPCVRIRNANNLSLAGNDQSGNKRGLSIATDLPLYVEGCFNTDGQKGRAGDDCTSHPSALVAADAVTMLSSNWKDSLRVPKWESYNPNTGIQSVRPDENLSSRVAVETTFNGILMTGIVESNDGTYSGGLQNLFRFHEHWRLNGTTPYNFNGSMVCMWLSKIAKNPIEGSYTYEPPSRPWGWAKMAPPGLPNIMNIQEFEWRRIDASAYVDDSFRQ